MHQLQLPVTVAYFIHTYAYSINENVSNVYYDLNGFRAIFDVVVVLFFNFVRMVTQLHGEGKILS
jgi:hypothetical protein